MTKEKKEKLNVFELTIEERLKMESKCNVTRMNQPNLTLIAKAILNLRKQSERGM